MSKKTIKAAKTASKTTKATADKTARAKELKRIRDAKYRAKKQAAKAQAKAAAADKPKEQAKPDGGCKQHGKCGAGKIIALLSTSMITNDVVLIAVAHDNAVPEALRRMAKSALDINHATIETVKSFIGKEGK